MTRHIPFLLSGAFLLSLSGCGPGGAGDATCNSSSSDYDACYDAGCEE